MLNISHVKFHRAALLETYKTHIFGILTTDISGSAPHSSSSGRTHLAQWGGPAWSWACAGSAQSRCMGHRPSHPHSVSAGCSLFYSTWKWKLEGPRTTCHLQQKWYLTCWARHPLKLHPPSNTYTGRDGGRVRVMEGGRKEEGGGRRERGKGEKRDGTVIQNENGWYHLCYACSFHTVNSNRAADVISYI